MSAAREIIGAALSARTVAEARRVDELIARHIGSRHERAVGDRINTHGLLATSGSYEYKLIENITNMQDAILERAAASRYGDTSDMPWQTPREAAAHLLSSIPMGELATKAKVELTTADEAARKSKRITAVFRDEGCGIEPAYVAESIFALGSAHKEKVFWQQGAFGIGGATTFRNADAVVLISRRAPEMRPEEDLILIAVCLWQRSVKGKGLFYLVVDEPRSGHNPAAVPWSAPASEYPEFGPGTHLALINYGTERIHAIGRSDNPNGFERVVNTRLFRPVTPIWLENKLTKDHGRSHTGLARRFEDNPRSDRREGQSHMPFRIEDVTYLLPVKFFFFQPPRPRGEDGSLDTTGQKRNFVADGHTVMFTSNGQVHHHWSPAMFRERTKLRQLADHLLVIIETDPLPIQVRTDFFTADRSGVRSSEDTLRLESDLAGHLDDWDELKELNAELIREALNPTGSERPTLEISKQISRAFAARTQGFKFQGNRNGNGAHKPFDRSPKPPRQLHNDPTLIKGPEKTTVLPGASKSLRFSIDAKDEFFASGRGHLTIRCAHPDIDDRDISIGSLRKGTVRVIVAAPTEAELGTFEITAGIYGWMKASGGIGDDLEWTTKLAVVSELPTPEPKPPTGKGDQTADGPQVALLWRPGEKVELLPKQPGKVEEIAANELAAASAEYRELAKLGETPVLTILLNEDYTPLKRYLQRRQSALSKIGLGHASNRYAIDVGVALLVLHHEVMERGKRGASLDEELLEVARSAAAQGALSILPHFDALAQEAGIEV